METGIVRSVVNEGKVKDESTNIYSKVHKICRYYIILYLLAKVAPTKPFRPKLFLASEDVNLY